MRIKSYYDQYKQKTLMPKESEGKNFVNGKGNGSSIDSGKGHKNYIGSCSGYGIELSAWFSGERECVGGKKT